MRRSCKFMKPVPEGWGPDWLAGMTPEQYVVALQNHCSIMNVKCEKRYDPMQQSKEMLHQAALSYNQAIATKLDNDMLIWKNINPDELLPDEWRIEGLVDKFADYKHIIVLAGPVVPIPAINQISNQRDSPYTNNSGRKKFVMRPIQCTCCKCGGHQIGTQVCRIGAQQFHILSYAKKHPKEFEENAKRYETVNKPKVIKKVCADIPLLTDLDHFLDESEDRHSLFHTDINEDK